MCAEKTIRFVQISDTHLLSEAAHLRGVDLDAGLRAVVGHIIQERQEAKDRADPREDERLQDLASFRIPPAGCATLHSPCSPDVSAVHEPYLAGVRDGMDEPADEENIELSGEESRAPLDKKSEVQDRKQSGEELSEESAGEIFPEKIPLDFLIHTGDLIQTEDNKNYGMLSPEENQKKLVRMAYERLAEALEPVGRRVYCVPGNHDSIEILKKTVDEKTLFYQRHLEIGPWQLIMLDSTVRGAPYGHFSEEELEYLDKTLASNGQYAIIFMHHPPVPVDSPWLNTMMIDNADVFFQITDRYPHVRALVFGHIHQEFEGIRKGIPLFGTPATALQFTAKDENPVVDHIDPGYREFLLYPDGRLKSRIRRVPV